MRRRNLLAILLSAAGCGRRRAQSEPIRVGVGPYLTMSGVYLAWERAYFQDVDLEVELVHEAGSAQAIPLLSAGKLDVAFFASNPSFVNAAAKGAFLRVVAGREQIAPDCKDGIALHYRKPAFPEGLSDLRLLRGKRISISRKASVTEFLLDTLLEHAGLSGSDIHVVQLGQPEAVAALVSGSIDGVVTSQLWNAPALVSREVGRCDAFARVMPYLQYSYVFYGRRLLEGEISTGVRFLAAYLRAAREFAVGATPKFMEEFARKNRLDPKVVQETCRKSFAADGRIDLPSLERFLRWTVDKDYCPASVQAEQLVDGRFLERQATV